MAPPSSSGPSSPVPGPAAASPATGRSPSTSLSPARRTRARSYPSSPSPSPPPSPTRSRLGSGDIPRTYSGLYGQGGPHSTDPSGNVTPDLLPFELSRNRNTDWIGGGAGSAGPSLLATYLGVLLAFELAVCAVVPFRASWTVTNVVHGVVTYVYLHWIKGSPDFFEQGEMNAMTFWEQLISSSGRPDDDKSGRDNPRRALTVVPTVLCHLACHFARYERRACALNVAVWTWCVVAKLDCMSGVRIWGINRTAGIDDDDDDDDAALAAVAAAARRKGQ